MKIGMLIIGLILVPALMIGGCSAIAWRKDEAAKNFCESIIPQTEAARAQGGQYPAQADPAWWAGKAVPSLIRTQGFYFADGSGFGFYFQNDSWFFDNAWSTRNGGRGWYSYDANFERK